MKRLLLTAVLIAISGCTVFQHKRSHNPYDNPFYMQFLDNGRALDRNIGRTVAALRANPNSPALHNQLGQLLVQKGFPKDSAREFERAIDLDSHFYPAWYNLGLVRAGMGDYTGARHAFNRTVSLQKGHAEALFQLGLMAERKGDAETAIDYYAKALRHNPDLIYVRVNPSVLDSKLIPLAMLKNYDVQHARERAVFMPAPAGYVQPQAQEAPSPQAPAQNIVPPAPPVTSPATQTPPPAVTTVPSASAPPRTTT